MSEDAMKESARQMDAWADEQRKPTGLAEQGFSGHVRMQMQTNQGASQTFTRPIGQQQEAGPNIEAALQRWLTAKIEFESATRDLEHAARMKRGY